MPLAPMTPARDIYRKEEAQKRQLQTGITAGEKLERTSVVSREQEVVPQGGGVSLSREDCGESVVEKLSKNIFREL